jgi:hypothetical protein
MQPSHRIYTGPPLDDPALLARLPADLAELLREENGFIDFHGGLHVRGICREPAWHSLANAWDGPAAFHCLYPEVRPDDIPFAEDCLGDQFLLREGSVWQLSAETGEMASMKIGLGDFFHSTEADPVEFLSLYPLLQFREEGGTLAPGELLSVVPPFCTTASANGVSLKAIPTHDRRNFLATLAAQIRDLPDGGSIEFRIEE